METSTLIPRAETPRFETRYFYVGQILTVYVFRPGRSEQNG
jgi:hypothetical protein